MRKLKRMIALVTVAMFLLSLAAPMASADTKTDAFDRLNALGVVYGDQNGDPMYDKNYTRAEAAAVMVQLSGMGAAIDAAKGATKFSDVPASHWASGVINLAVGAGIIKGYPNGTYQPEKSVSYAEMCAMLVQVLGYGPKLQGTWPSNVIGKAAELGLLDSLSISNYNDPAVRSNVFIAADNALETEILQENKDGYETEDGETLMTEKLNAVELEDVVVTEVSSAVDSIEKNQITLLGNFDTDAALEEKTFDVVSKTNLLSFLGQKVKAYANDDDEIISLKSDEDEVFVDTIKSVDSTKVLFYDKGSKEKASGMQVFENFEGSVNNVTPAAGDYVIVVMDGSKVSKMQVISLTEYGIVEEVEDNKIIMKEDPSSSDIDLDDVDMDYVQIYKNGKVATLDDIKADDLVASINNSDKWTIFVSDKKFEGKLDVVTPSAGNAVKLVVGDNAARSINVKTLEYSTDNGDSYSDANLSNLNDDVIGEDVKVYVNPWGQATYLVADDEAEGASNKVVVRNITSDDNPGSNTDSTVKYIKVTKADGTDVTYEIDNDDYTVNMVDSYYGTLDLDDADGTGSADVSAKDIVKISLNSAGKVTDIDTLSDIVTLRAGATGINVDNKVMYGTDNLAYVVSDDTVFIQVDEYGNSTNYIDENKKISWATVDDNESAIEGLAANKVKFYVEDKEVVIALIDSDLSLSSDDMYGVAVNGSYAVGGGDYNIKILVNGELKSYKLDDTVDNFAYGNAPVVFAVNADGDIDEIARVVDNAAGYYDIISQFEVKNTKSVGDKLIIVYEGSDASTSADDVEYIVNKDKVKYFDNTGATIEEDGSISRGDVVVLYDFLDKDGDVASASSGDNAADGIYDYVVIVD